MDKESSGHPQLLADDHPLARVGGVTNAIVFTTGLLGDVAIMAQVPDGCKLATPSFKIC